MKKLLALIVLTIVVALALCLAGCGNSGSSSAANTGSLSSAETQHEEVAKYKVGDTVSTDLLEFTLNDSQFAIALNNQLPIGAEFTYDNTYYLPKDYNPEADAKNSYVAAKGHAFVSYVFTLRNLDRSSLELDRSSMDNDFISIYYNSAEYTGSDVETHYGYSVNQDGKWSATPVSNILLLSGETKDYRACADIPVEIDDLASPYEITFYFPNSDGSKTAFTYVINQ